MQSCAVCQNYIESCDPANLIHKTDRFTITINPRWSPHLGRIAIFPNRHIGNEGVYGFESLTSEEREEFIELRKKMTDALKIGFAQYGMKLREGVAHIDCIVRPAMHPSADLFPSYDQAPVFENYNFPSYKNVSVQSGSAPQAIKSASVILASFANPDLLMPEGLRKKLSTCIKERLG